MGKYVGVVQDSERQTGTVMIYTNAQAGSVNSGQIRDKQRSALLRSPSKAEEV